MPDPERALRLVGLGRRAGRVAVGAQAVQQSVQRRRARLLLVAADAAPRSRRELDALAARASLPLLVVGDAASLGRYCGRSHCVAVAVEDEALAAGITAAMADEHGDL